MYKHTIIQCLIVSISLVLPLYADTNDSLTTLLTQATTLMNDLLEKLPCDLPTSIHTEDMPFTITNAGYYCLASDLGSADPIDIKITASNVHLNLTGHTIDLGGTGGIGIEVSNCTSVTLMNGIIQNSTSTGTGIHICSGSQKITVDGIITINCATGISSEDSNSITIKNSLFQNGQIGVSFSAVANNGYDYVLAKSSCINNTVAGIQVQGGAETTLNELKIRDCHIVNSTLNSSTTNPTYGIQVSAAKGITVHEVTLDTHTTGISISNACDVKVADSKVLNVAANGIETFVTTGKALQNSMQSFLFDRVMIDTASGISMKCSTTNQLRIKDCQMLNAAQNALFLDGCNSAKIDDCVLCNAAGSSAAILVIGDNNAVNTARINNCIIENNAPGTGLNGVEISNARNVSIEHSTISTGGTGSNNILIQGSIANCLISHCSITDAVNGLSYTNVTDENAGANLTIDHCHIFNCSSSGISVANALNCIIRNCELAFCGTAINLSAAQTVTIMNNIIQTCYVAGINIDDQCLRIGARDNVFTCIYSSTSNNGVGINNEPQAENAIFHNFAYGNYADYQGVDLVVAPGPNIGAHENVAGLGSQ